MHWVSVQGGRLQPLPLRAGALLGALMLVVAGALLWSSRSDNRLHLIVPAIPGDGLLLRASGGQIALIDGGADGTAVASWLGSELPLWQRRIDVLILTRADETTLPGQLAAARRYRVGQAILAQPGEPQPLWDELVRLLREQGTPVHAAQVGDRIVLGPEAILQVLTVANGRLTLDLTTGAGRVLLFQSLADGQDLPRPGRGPVAAAIYPWRRTAPDPALQELAPQAIIFGEQPGTDPQLSLAERRVGAAKLLHEALDGRIDLSFDEQGMHVAVARRRGK